jgi:hypothetical protein
MVTTGAMRPSFRDARIIGRRKPYPMPDRMKKRFNR